MAVRVKTTVRTGNLRTRSVEAALASVLGTQTGMLQLAVAARLANMDGGMDGLDANNTSSIARLVGAADQSANTLANVAAGIGTNLDMSC
jgi:hypothetical protein